MPYPDGGSDRPRWDTHPITLTPSPIPVVPLTTGSTEHVSGQLQAIAEVSIGKRVSGQPRGHFGDLPEARCCLLQVPASFRHPPIFGEASGNVAECPALRVVDEEYLPVADGTDPLAT